MLKDNLLKYGILKCRDLVELYYGAPMVTSVHEDAPAFTPLTPFQLLKQDPRRIRYEILIANFDTVSNFVGVGTHAAIDTATAEQYAILPGSQVYIVRDFFGDLDAVTIAQWCMSVSGNVNIFTRETFLTPAPVDEVPLA